jgi:hypothetical protein
VSKFTPGPWCAVQVAAPMSRSKDGKVWAIIAVEPMRGRIDSQLEGISEPNARLMAAAPDLYEALRVARTYVEWCAQRDGWLKKNGTDLTAIDAALAKAEGVQP